VRVLGQRTRNPKTALSEASVVRKHQPDYVLALLAIALLAVGFVVVYAISPGIAAAREVSEQYLVNKQIIAIALGIISFLLLSAIPYTLWKKFLPILIGASILLTLVALITPVNAQYPAHRWVRFSGLSFQTAEFVKLTLLIWAASFFSMKAARAELTDTKKTLRPALYIVGTIAFVIAGLQSDLGSAAVMVAIIVMLAYLAGMPLTKFVPLGAIVTGLVLVVFAASYVVPSLHYRVGRFNTFLNPTSE
jgi:cell division protein FtsW